MAAEPITDEGLAFLERRLREERKSHSIEVTRRDLVALIARVRQAEQRADQWRQKRRECAQRADDLMARALDAEAALAEANREQVRREQDGT